MTGGPGTNAEIKLIDIPEMNYTSNDLDDQGNPMPRGEILVRYHTSYNFVY